VRTRAAFLGVYLLSGAAALLYEVLWLRLLTLSMGHTAGAVGIVLAAFMGGLAAGAWYAGRIAESLPSARALRVYAWLELAIGGWAVLVPLIVPVFRPVLAWAYADGEGARIFHLTLGTLSFLTLFIPAALMGATYPIAVRWFAHHADRALVGASGLYAVNTVGAAVGAALAGFVLLPQLGLRATTLVGVGLNVAAALGALWLGDVRARPALSAVEGRRRAPTASDGDHRTTSDRDYGTASDVAQLRLAATAVAVSGFAALVYQVTWTRVLAMVLGPTTYAFSAMLVAVITGLAIGSGIATALISRTGQPRAWLGGAMMAAAAAALIACLGIDRLPLVLADVTSRPDLSFDSILMLQVGVVIAILMPMTIALGAAFPLAVAVAAPQPAHVPGAVAAIYASNTAGAIAGALAGSLLLIPAWGLQASIRAVAVIGIVTGAVVCWGGVSRRGRLLAAAGAAAATALAWLVPAWNADRLANGGYRYASALAAGDLQIGLEAGRLLYYGEGAAGTVSVRQLPGVVSLAIDGKVDASNAADMLTQKLLAHLPLLLHQDPRTVCVIGLGSGVTLGAALRHPIERADVIEISPEVVAASEFFATENHRALADPRTRLVVGDGRSHLLLSKARYDVIISEPSNPWMAGVAALFTREFFEAARARLAPGGIVTQWAHTYSISDEDLRSIVATFLSVFPDGTAWLVGESDLLLIGSTAPLEALDRGLAHSWDRANVAADLAEVSVREPFSLLTLFVARGTGLQQYAEEAPVQEDDRLGLEYSAPRAMYGRFQRSNVDRLREAARRTERPPAVIQAAARATPAEWRHRGLMQLRADAVDLAFDDLRQAVAQDARDTEALNGLGRAAARSGRLEEAEAFLTDVAARSGSAPPLVELSIVIAARGRVDEATEAARQAVIREPGNTAAIRQLASMYADRGDETALEQLTRIMDRLTQDAAVALYTRTRLAYLRSDFAQAAELGEKLVASDGTNPTALNLLGSIHAALGRHERARQLFEASLRIVPRDPLVLVNLGTIALRSADAAAAQERFSEALFLSPTLMPALDGLAQALEQQGQASRAAAIRGRMPSPEGTP
jgi:spermidine synthase